MHPVSAFNADKNQIDGQLKQYILLIEIEYATAQFFRVARAETSIVFLGQTWSSFGIGDINITQNSRGEIPGYDIPLANVGREVQSILEFYNVAKANGRLLWVHPDMLSDSTAYIEERFVIASAVADEQNAVLTVVPVRFDPLGIRCPTDVVTVEKFPGVLGSRARFLV